MQSDQRRDQLVSYVKRLGSCLVAYSGGVDSAVVAKAAAVALGDKAIAVTAVSASLADGELESASRLADQIGIRHEIVRTDELQRPGYVANGFDRCYFCKSELYHQLQPLLTRFEVNWILNGTNADDLHDHRPGLKAAQESRVVSPLAELGITKAEVRSLARYWQLAAAEKLASPCLASRIAYGEPVTVARLQMIDNAEQWLRERGYSDLRVRLHRDDLARIEVPADQIARLATEVDLSCAFQALGFKFVTLDLQGRRSGSLNVVVPIDELQQSARQQSMIR